MEIYYVGIVSSPPQECAYIGTVTLAAGFEVVTQVDNDNDESQTNGKARNCLWIHDRKSGIHANRAQIISDILYLCIKNGMWAIFLLYKLWYS